MPATSAKQRIAMAIAEHHPGKLYKRNKGLTRMSHSQLHDFAATKGLPKMHSGGLAMEDGPHMLKAGEMVIPKGMTSQLHKMMYKNMMAGAFGHKG